MKRIILFFLSFSLLVNNIFSFDWPQENVQNNSFSTFFGQKRAQTICNSLVFSESEIAKSTDKGTVAIVLSEHDDCFNCFESTLGTAVIVSHDDSLLTVYGNLDTENLSEKIYDDETVKTGTPFSTTGNSAWQNGKTFLEFQIIDTKNNNYVNPLILMPRIEKYEPISFQDIMLQDKNGKNFDLNSTQKLHSGVYKVYKRRQPLAIPYQISVSVNGREYETTTFDTIAKSQNDLAIQGRNLYKIAELYPDENKILLGEIYLSHGNNILTILLTDFARNEKTRTFRISAY